MTPEEIIAMAKDAGLLPDTSHPTPETRHMRKKAESVHRFAALVAAKEREACAEIADAEAGLAAHLIAKRIRAMGAA